LKMLFAARDKELRELRDEVKGIREERQHRQEEAEQARVDELIVTTADSRIKELLIEHKLPEKAFGVIQKVIAMSDPDLYDPITKALTEQSVRAAIGKQFATILPELSALRGTQGLKLEPAKKPGTAPAKPKAEEKPSEPETKRAKRPDPFAGSAEELQDKIAAAMGGGGQDYA